MTATIRRNFLRVLSVLSVTALLSLGGQAQAATIFSENFDGFTAPGGNFNGGQHDTNLTLAHTGSLPGWAKVGSGAVHAIDHANTGAGVGGATGNPSNYAPMMWASAANIITMSSSIAGSNSLGESYEVSFLASPTVYQQDGQKTGATDGLLIEVLRADNSVLASLDHLPGAWDDTSSAFDLQSASFSFVGDGSGDIKFRIGPNAAAVANSHFGGAIDNLSLSTVPENVPEPASIAIWTVLGLCLAGYGYRRRKK